MHCPTCNSPYEAEAHLPAGVYVCPTCGVVHMVDAEEIRVVTSDEAAALDEGTHPDSASAHQLLRDRVLESPATEGIEA